MRGNEERRVARSGGGGAKKDQEERRGANRGQEGVGEGSEGTGKGLGGARRVQERQGSSTTREKSNMCTPSSSEDSSD